MAPDRLAELAHAMLGGEHHDVGERLLGAHRRMRDQVVAFVEIALVQVLDQREQQLAFGGKVVVKRADRLLGTFGNLLHGGLVVFLGEKQLVRRREDALARALLLAFSKARDPRHAGFLP